MEITEKIEFIKKSIKSQKKHQDYQRVNELAKEYYSHITGDGLDSYLQQFTRREEASMFDQRKRLTNAINPALANSLQKPFYKVSRNDKISKTINLKDPVRETIVNKMISYFYGSKNENNRGLDYWLRMRFIELTFADPNAFLVMEWEGKDPTEILEPRPFEVSSEEAINYEIRNDELKWLLCKFKYIYIQFDGSDEKEVSGEKYNFYDQDHSFRVEQFDPRYHEKINFQIAPNQLKLEIDKKHFLFTWNEPKVGYVPAFRIGYVRDLRTKGRTFVNPFDSAMTFFRKSLKVVSELDLTMTLHAFPQKWQYAERCKGEGKRRCDGGKIAGTSETCPSCKGSGVKTHTTAQDIIYLPLPDDPENKDLLDLEKLSAYKYPPIDLMKFQNDFVIQLKEEAHLAVFNSNMFLASDPQFAKTATEITDNMEAVYDTIEPYTEKISEVWKFIVKVMTILSGHQITDETDINHSFPSDLKLKTTSMILNELKSANESGAPSFLIDSLVTDLAGQVFAGDKYEHLKYYVRHRFFPFNGKSADEKQYLIGSDLVSDFTKILYANFEAIFTDIDKAYPYFYTLNYLKQWEIVEQVTKKFQDEIKAQKTPSINFNLPQ